MAELNEKLIACVLDHIERDNDEYDQNEWCVLKGDQDNDFCGTRACFAGWAVLLSTPIGKWWEVRYGGNARPMKEVARELLGLTYDEAHTLFQGVDYANQRNVYIVKDRLRRIRTARGLPPDGPTQEKAEVKDES